MSIVAKVRSLQDDIFVIFTDPKAFDDLSSLQAYSQAGVSAYVTEEIKTNHVWAFHYSAALFFRRALCADPAGPMPPEKISTRAPTAESSSHNGLTGQHLVSKAFEHLENIDALSGRMAIANTLWPGFVAAAEAVDTELRHRAIAWFARARRHGIGNIAPAKALVMEVWRRVDLLGGNAHGQLGRVDWRDVMREKGMYIMLT